jgi:hypothetical protein
VELVSSFFFLVVYRYLLPGVFVICYLTLLIIQEPFAVIVVDPQRTPHDTLQRVVTRAAVAGSFRRMYLFQHGNDNSFTVPPESGMDVTKLVSDTSGIRLRRWPCFTVSKTAFHQVKRTGGVLLVRPP